MWSGFVWGAGATSGKRWWSPPLSAPPLSAPRSFIMDGGIVLWRVEYNRVVCGPVRKFYRRLLDVQHQRAFILTSLVHGFAARAPWYSSGIAPGVASVHLHIWQRDFWKGAAPPLAACYKRWSGSQDSPHRRLITAPATERRDGQNPNGAFTLAFYHFSLSVTLSLVLLALASRLLPCSHWFFSLSFTSFHLLLLACNTLSFLLINSKHWRMPDLIIFHLGILLPHNRTLPELLAESYKFLSSANFIV